MFRAIYVSAFLAGIISPKNEDYMLAPFRQRADGRIGECFPALVLMRARRAGADGEGGIEKEDSLIRPARQVAIAIRFYSKITFDFFKNILQ